MAITVCVSSVESRGQTASSAQSILFAAQDQSTQVNIRWGARPGVSRYRLQVARDEEFTDIVFDRVIYTNRYQIGELTPGRYFWRVAALTETQLIFSSATPIDVGAPSGIEGAIQTDTTPVSKPIVTGDGWRALIGDISTFTLAHLRSQRIDDVVAAGSEGVVYALAGDSGIVLWTARTGAAPTNSTRPIPLLTVGTTTELDNVIVLANNAVIAFNGGSGRELWREVFPAVVFDGAVVNDVNGPQIFVIDNSRQRLFLLDGQTGKVTSQTQLPARVFGAPTPFEYEGVRGALIAFENGRIEIRDAKGKLVRAGDARSIVTTSPLFINSARGGLLLVGTRSGLTALDARDMHALGRTALKEDAPRGTLAASDLNGDGSTEVIMLTDRGHVVAVNASDGKILWDVPSATDTASLALADVNGDRVLDVLIAGGQNFAIALSGRDGSVVWKEESASLFAANHTASLTPRSLAAVPHGAGALLIGIDPARNGLRAVEFSKGRVSQISR